MIPPTKTPPSSMIPPIGVLHHHHRLCFPHRVLSGCKNPPLIFAFGDSNSDTGGLAAGLGYSIFPPKDEASIFCSGCKDEASIFCSADEAALCAACDHRVHQANKLAGKHQCFSLLPPSPKNLSLCDICQEKSAFLFCQQDRAILCRDCDISIHKVNELTKSHHRLQGMQVLLKIGFCYSNCKGKFDIKVDLTIS